MCFVTTSKHICTLLKYRYAFVKHIYTLLKRICVLSKSPPLTLFGLHMGFPDIRFQTLYIGFENAHTHFQNAELALQVGKTAT